MLPNLCRGEVPGRQANKLKGHPLNHRVHAEGEGLPLAGGEKIAVGQRQRQRGFLWGGSDAVVRPFTTQYALDPPHKPLGAY